MYDCVTATSNGMDRLVKVNELINIEIGKILQSELELPSGVFVTIVSVDTSRTLEHAKVKISVLPLEKADQVLKEIKNQIYDIQQILNKKLIMRKIPKIRFEIDTTEERASRIDRLLDIIEK